MRPAARPEPETLANALSTLRARFGERLAEGEAIRRQHGNQLSEVPNQPPDAVVFPETTAEVCEAVRVCAEHRIPIIPFGVGSSFEGHVNAPFGGLSIDMSRMKRIVARQCQRPRLHRRSRRDADRAQQPSARRAVCSFRSTPAPTPRWAAWRRRARQARMRCGTEPCATTCWH